MQSFIHKGKKLLITLCETAGNFGHFQGHWQGLETRDHRLSDAQSLSCVAQARVGKLLLGAEEDKDGDEGKHGSSPGSQAGSDKEHGDDLADPGCDLCGGEVAHLRCQERAEDAAAVHREKQE